MSEARILACPQCGRPVEWVPASRWRPFCSERCKMIDFGAWATETYRVPAVEPPDGEEIVGEGDERERAPR
jgi:endogenous inhibitor of DNA gyrase (YacG/DUF329 family)